MGTLQKPKLIVKSLSHPDETRPFAAKGHADIIQLDNGTALKGTFEPGWRWSQHVQPIAKTKSCQAPHLGYVVSGRMTIRMDDGTEAQIGPGDVFRIPPGHDAWVDGNETCVLMDFGGYDYAKSTSPSAGAGATSTSTHQNPPRK